MKPQIDKLYVYRQRERAVFYSGFKELNQRVHETDFRFMRGNVPDKADNVYRYALTVEINDVSRTFLLVTMESSKTKIAKFFASAKKQIEEDPKLMKKFIVAISKPVETPLTYGN